MTDIRVNKDLLKDEKEMDEKLGKKGERKIERREEIGIQLLNLTEKKLLDGVVVVDDDVVVDGDKLVSGKSSVVVVVVVVSAVVVVVAAVVVVLNSICEKRN